RVRPGEVQAMARELSRIDAHEPEAPALTPAQCRAVAALAGGSTVTAAAAAAGVSRPTVYAWLDQSGAFVAALNRARAEQLEAIRGELRGLATAAVRTLRTLVESAEAPAAVRLKAALAVLAAVGADRPEPIGPTDPEMTALAQRERADDIAKRDLLAGLFTS